MKTCTSSLLASAAFILALIFVAEAQYGGYYGSSRCHQHMRDYVNSDRYCNNRTGSNEDCRYIRGYYWCVLPELFYYNPSEAELSRVQQNFQREFPEFFYINCNIDLRQVADMRFEMRQFDSYATIYEGEMMKSAGVDRFNTACMLGVVGTILLTTCLLHSKIDLY